MDSEQPEKSLPPERFNPVAFVTGEGPRKRGIERALAVAEAAKDSFSIGEAIVDGWVFINYATGARRLVGMP